MEQTLGNIFLRSSNKVPDKAALGLEGQILTYGELNRKVNRLANGLKGLGAKKGDRVALLFYNCFEILESYLACAKIGAIVVPVNFRFVEKEMLYVIKNSESSFLLFGKEFHNFARYMSSEKTGLGAFVGVMEEENRGSFPGLYSYHELLSKSEGKEPKENVEEKTPFAIMYTSGTTGFPKGCLWNHRNFAWYLMTNAYESGAQPTERFLCVYPIFHAGGFGLVALSLFLGATAFLKKSFDPVDMLNTIQEEKITYLALVAPMIPAILQCPDWRSYDLSSVRKCSVGAMATPIEMKKTLMDELFPRADIREPYGLTEATSASLTTLGGRDFLRKTGSCGRPTVTAEVRVVDDSGKQLPPGAIGEIVARSPCVTQGYYKNPEATAETWREGWLRTGDLGRMDEEGFLYIVDRKKDMIISGGENIYPVEIENVLYRHPKIKEAAVIGVPDPVWGESVKAFVVPKVRNSLTEEEIVDFCKMHLAGYKKPKLVEFVDDLPKNPVGKILKKLLRERSQQQNLD